MKISKKYGPGIIFIVVALVFGINAVASYKFGDLLKPGPALFPAVVSTILFIAGLISISTTATKEVAYLDVRALLIIVAGLLSFAIGTVYINMAVGIAALVYITSYAIKEQMPKYQNIKIVTVLIAAAAVFKYALGMSIPLWK